MKKIHNLETAALNGGVGATTSKAKTNSNELSTTESKINVLWKASEKGCEDCNHNGYRGRIGIYEVLDNSVEIQKLIVSNATSDVIQEQATREGMLIMQLDGFIKALRGQTTVEEILRVTAEE